MTTEPKTRTITLTDRPPVRIREDQWPVIAEAQADSWGGHRGDGRYHQALYQGELDRWTLKVREHADGRVLVYGVFKAASYRVSPGNDWRGGELLDPDDLGTWEQGRVAAIYRVGADGSFPEHVIRECVADLPVEDL